MQFYKALNSLVIVIKAMNFRLDDYVKQLAEKEVMENRMKFLNQQLQNAHAIQKELKTELESAINRANTVSKCIIQFSMQYAPVFLIFNCHF